MPSVLEPVPDSVVEGQTKPFLKSYDSGPEHSLDHWLAVRRMVEEEYTFLDADFEWREASALS
jgi:hypothetical protein